MGVRDCEGPTGELGPRGAAEQEDFLRQQAKIVAAIDALDADVVSLEEIENSALFGKDRDDAVRRLVEALNEATGQSTWDFVPSPPGAPGTSPATRRTPARRDGGRPGPARTGSAAAG